MLIKRTYKETAKVSKEGHKALAEFLLLQQRLYNGTLQERESYHCPTGQSISQYDQCNSLKVVREELPEYERYSVHAVRSELLRVDRAFKSYFKRVKAKKLGYPRYKSLNRIRSLDCPAGGITIRQTSRRWAERIQGLELFFAKSIPGRMIKEIRVVQTDKRVVIQFVVEKEIDVTPSNTAFVGIDLGIESLITLSNGENIPGSKRKIERHKKRQRKQRVNARKNSKQKAKTKWSLATAKKEFSIRNESLDEKQFVYDNFYKYTFRLAETGKVVQGIIIFLESFSMTKLKKIASNILRKIFILLAFVYMLMSANLVSADSFTDAIIGEVDGDPSVSKRIEKGIDLNNIYDSGYTGFTPLTLASILCKPKTAQILLKAGADINKSDDYGPPLYYSVTGNCAMLTKILIDSGANAMWINNRNGANLLHYAILWGTDSEVIDLIDAGTDINGLTTDGRTPLHVLLNSEGVEPWFREERVKLLRKYGANDIYVRRSVSPNNVIDNRKRNKQRLENQQEE